MRVKMLRTHTVDDVNAAGWLQSKTYYAEGGEYQVSGDFGAELVASGAAEDISPPDPEPVDAEWKEG